MAIGISPHYQKIWQTVQAIPPGRVASYGQIADLAGLPGRSRLVGKSLAYVASDMDLPCIGFYAQMDKLPFLQDLNRPKSKRAYCRRKVSSCLTIK